MRPVFFFYLEIQMNENCLRYNEKNEKHSDKKKRSSNKYRWFVPLKRKKNNKRREKKRNKGRTLIFSIQVSIHQSKRNKEINAKNEKRAKKVIMFPREIQPKVNSSSGRGSSSVVDISSTPRVLRKSGPNRL